MSPTKWPCVVSRAALNSARLLVNALYQRDPMYKDSREKLQLVRGPAINYVIVTHFANIERRKIVCCTIEKDRMALK